MLRLSLYALILTPVVAQAAPEIQALLLPKHSAAILLIAALFYFGYRWRAR